MNISTPEATALPTEPQPLPQGCNILNGVEPRTRSFKDIFNVKKAVLILRHCDWLENIENNLAIWPHCFQPHTAHFSHSRVKLQIWAVVGAQLVEQSQKSAVRIQSSTKF